MQFTRRGEGGAARGAGAAAQGRRRRDRRKAHVERIERAGRPAPGAHRGQETRNPRWSSALRVIIAIGRSGNYRALGVPGREARQGLSTASTTRRNTRARTCWWSAAATRRWRRRSRWRWRGAAVTLSYRKQGVRAPQARQRREDSSSCSATPTPTSPSRSRRRSASIRPMTAQHGRGQARPIRLMMASQGEGDPRRRGRARATRRPGRRRCPTTWCSP